MISVKEALELVSAQAHSFGREIIMLDEALGRTLNEAVIADRDYPPFNRSTMDGIAINSKDFNAGIRTFELVETIFAGQPYTKNIDKGSCYKIMTGASVPPSADTVIRKEDLEQIENRLTVTVSELKKEQNIALKGSDIKKDAVIIEKPVIINPGIITTLASLGYAEVKVAKLPSAAVLTTGNEVVQVDAPVNDVQIRNSNIFLLKALLQQWQIKPVVCRHLTDDADVLLHNIKQQLHNDIIILSGAVSAGDADFVPAVLEKAGARKIFHQVAIRPGKPIWFGKFDRGPIVFALPGNPFSTFVTFKLLIDSFLTECFGLEKRKMLQFPFDGERIKKTNLDEFFPVTITGSPSTASAVDFNNSGDITAVMQADALAMQPVEQVVVKTGDIVGCLSL